MKIADALRLTGEAILNALYPPHCAQCLAETASGVHLCPGCAARAPKIQAPFCRQCSQPFDGAIEGEFVCGQCREQEWPFDCAVACYRSRDVVREFIHRFKYERHFYLRRPLGDWLAESLEDERIASRPFDALVRLSAREPLSLCAPHEAATQVNACFCYHKNQFLRQ